MPATARRADRIFRTMSKPIRRRSRVVAIAVLLLGVVAALAWPLTGRTLLARAFAGGDDRAAGAAARVRPALDAELATHGVAVGAPVFLRIFKEERELELWMRTATSHAFRLVKTY